MAGAEPQKDHDLGKQLLTRGWMVRRIYNGHTTVVPKSKQIWLDEADNDRLRAQEKGRQTDGRLVQAIH